MLLRYNTPSGPIRHRFSRTTTPITVGRTASNTLRLKNSAVARRHMQFALEEGAWKAIDLDSHCGIFINDHQITHIPIKPGDAIRCGQPILHIDPEPPHNTSEALEKLRTLLTAPPNAARWDATGDILAAWPDNQDLDVAIDYIRHHTDAWPAWMLTPPDTAATAHNHVLDSVHQTNPPPADLFNTLIFGPADPRWRIVRALHHTHRHRPTPLINTLSISTHLTHLKHFSLHHSPLSFADAAILAHILGEYPGITHLSLLDTNLDENRVGALFPPESWPALQNLDLDHNSINAATVSKLLRKITTIRHLSMADNLITGHRFDDLLQSLEHTPLTTLDLTWNAIPTALSDDLRAQHPQLAPKPASHKLAGHLSIRLDGAQQQHPIHRGQHFAIDPGDSGAMIIDPHHDPADHPLLTPQQAHLLLTPIKTPTGPALRFTQINVTHDLTLNGFHVEHGRLHPGQELRLAMISIHFIPTP